MQQRRFGSTDLTVSEAGFGCARIGGVFEGSTKADLVRLLHAAFEQGVTFYDTADMYTQGESERLLGEAFRGRRDQIVIASKAGFCLPTQKKAVARIKPLVRPVFQRLGIKRESIPASLKGTITQDFAPAYLVKAVEGSLRRLRTDYLDLFQLHSPPTEVLEKGEFLDPLEKLRREGKIRYYGVSCETTPDALICLRYPEIAALQIRLSLLEQSPLAQVLPRARARGVAVIARECFAGGMLAKPLAAVNAAEITAELVELHRLAGQAGQPLAQTAAQFVLGLEGISVVLFGMRTAEQLAGNLQYAAAPRLAPAELSRLLPSTPA